MIQGGYTSTMKSIKGADFSRAISLAAVSLDRVRLGDQATDLLESCR